MKDINAYLPILKVFKEHQLHFLLMGTWALKWTYPKLMEQYEVTDCDLLIKNSQSSIINSITLLKANGWTVSVWEEEIDAGVTATFLKGKYYLRAQQASLVLDLTYECSLFSWPTLWSSKIEVKGMPVAGLSHMLALKKEKGRDKDLQVVELFENQIKFR